jgi:GGDEF domain-containing protein
MPRPSTHQSTQRVLLIGDRERHLATAIAGVAPGADVRAVPSLFDGIAELHASYADGGAQPFQTVFASVEPMERRPEAAVRTLRELSGSAQLVLFGHPTLEPLSRKMLEFGVDDYVVTPASPTELQQLFGQPPLRIAPPAPVDPSPDIIAPPTLTDRLATLTALPVAEIVLDALLQHPGNALRTAVANIAGRIGPTLRLHFDPTGTSSPPSPPEGMTVLSHPVRGEQQQPAGNVFLTVPIDEDESGARHALAQLSLVLGRAAGLDERHRRLQKLAITDDLTGVYNVRWFRHFLDRILDKARQRHFSVTLLLFDIDNFKKYNDTFGHAVGDEILRQTASLMKRCCRDHDVVARISGDEFAVIFWENEGPRLPREPGSAPAARVPQTPLQIADRFRRLLQSNEFTALGPSGQGTLTISGGMAVYPWDAQNPQGLIEAADRALMFGAKKSGKNSISLVGEATE